jgi:N-acyl-D-amino-acid deacylase
MPKSFLLVLGILLAVSRAQATDVLLTNTLLFDGSGQPPHPADVRIRGDRIVAVARHLQPHPNEAVRDEHGRALAPGFIDMHSHGNRGLLKDLDAATISRQGVTTIFVGQDGESDFPLADFFSHLAATPAAINVASMVGHATLRQQVMGKDLYRPSTAAELASMKSLLAKELQAGAFGISTGLEYEEAHFATTEEVIELSKVAAAKGGFYISHVRDEGTHTFESFDEILRIGREAHIPVEITHIKLGATSLWHQAASRFPGYFEAAQRDHVNLKADVYPYAFWHSTLRVIVPDRDYFNPTKVKAALAENGGAAAIRISRYAPDPALAGKTLEEFAAAWHITPVDAYMRVIRETSSEVGNNAADPLEEVDVTSMSEDDVRWFVSQPSIMICSDGELHGSHPRGAGAFPRVLGRYVREQKALSLESAIHKMTGLPARQLGLEDRGRIAAGYVADLVIFDPATVKDGSTIEHPEAPPLGIPAVMVAGEWVIDDGRVTGNHPGHVLRPGQRQH